MDVRISMDTILETEEFILIQQALDGDQDAFCSLVFFYEGPLVIYLYAFLGDWESARDIAQETFVSAYYALPDWKAPNSYVDSSKIHVSKYIDDHPLSPWLYRIAMNKALTFLKQKKKSVILLAPQDLYFRHESTEYIGDLDHSVSMEDQYILRELIQGALSLINEEDAICIVFRFVFDEKYSEIAERLHMSKEAVRKRISRGLVTLRSAFTSIDEKENLQ